MQPILKISLAILFLLCLLNMPYGYYQLVRYLAMVGFGYMAYESYREKREKEVLLYIALAILFQPVFKIALGRTLWNIVDVIIAIGLIVNVYQSKRKK